MESMYQFGQNTNQQTQTASEILTELGNKIANIPPGELESNKMARQVIDSDAWRRVTEANYTPSSTTQSSRPVKLYAMFALAIVAACSFIYMYVQ